MDASPGGPITGFSGRTPELEALARRLLELLGRVSGLESTYLTLIDWDGQSQEVLYARNVGDLEVPEGIRVPWMETLCRHAIEGGPRCTSDVRSLYPDNAAARDLGISTYVTAPVIAPDGSVFGTICGASSRSADVAIEVQQLIDAVAEMFAMQLAQDAVARLLSDQAEALAEANAALQRLALTDELTGVANRRAFETDLARAASVARRDDARLAVLSVDVDRFKAINDGYGHAAGDEVLRAVADHLRRAVREGDVVARVGGDEFTVVLSPTDDARAHWTADRIRAEISAGPIATSAGPVGVSVSIGVATGDGRDPMALTARADAALYEAKAAGRNRVRA